MYAEVGSRISIVFLYYSDNFRLGQARKNVYINVYLYNQSRLCYLHGPTHPGKFVGISGTYIIIRTADEEASSYRIYINIITPEKWDDDRTFGKYETQNAKIFSDTNIEFAKPYFPRLLFIVQNILHK